MLGISFLILLVLWVVLPKINWEPYATGVSALLIPLVLYYRVKIDSLIDPNKVERIGRDKQVFVLIDKLLDEDFIVRVTNEVGGSARCTFGDQNLIELFVDEIEKSKYVFLIKGIEAKKLALIDRIVKVRDFMRYNFDCLDNPNLKYSKLCYPDENPFGIREEYKDHSYHQLYDILRELLCEMKDAYTDFRFEIKISLHL